MRNIRKFLINNFRLYPHSVQLSGLRWYNAGQDQISCNSAMGILEKADNVALTEISIGPTYAMRTILSIVIQ